MIIIGRIILYHTTYYQVTAVTVEIMVPNVTKGYHVLNFCSDLKIDFILISVIGRIHLLSYYVIISRESSVY